MITFYDPSGSAVCYLIDGDITIYMYTGEPVAWIEAGLVYAYSGEFLGWYQGGQIWDQWGRVVLFGDEAVGGPAKPARHARPARSARYARPARGARQATPARPALSPSWSELTPRQFFRIA